MRGKKISTDLKRTIVALGSIHSVSEIEALTAVSRRQIYRIRKMWETTGYVEPAHVGRRTGRPRFLTPAEEAYVVECARKSPDIYLVDLQLQMVADLGVTVSRSLIWRTLRRNGLTMKKASRVAAERSAFKRAEYVLRISCRYTNDQLVFADESSFDRRVAHRTHAWAVKGQRAMKKVLFCRGKRYSVLPALTLNGIIALDIVEGSYNTERFKRFICGLLDQMNPFPGPRSVIVMDNCRIHKSKDISDMIYDRGMRCEFLPPYSPDYNPIELAFSAIKADFCHCLPALERDTTTGDEIMVLISIHKSVFSITPQDVCGWFHRCGYG